MKLSIITVNYNNAKGLERTIQSVITQSYQDFEFIIIDGGSNDDSVNIIKKYESHIDYWISEPDGGIYAGMNKGLTQAKGDFVNFMNSGDCYYKKDVLGKIFSLNTDADIITGAHIGSPHPNIGKEGITMYDLYTGAVDHQASFIRRELAIRHPYDEGYRIVSDWKFFIEALIIDNCSFYYTDTIVVDVDKNGISNTNVELNEQERNMVLKEIFPEKIIKDYQFLASIHPKLLKISPEITKSQSILNLVVKFAELLIKIKNV